MSFVAASRIARAYVLVSLVCIAACRPSAPTPTTSYEGTWVMRLGARVFLVMTIERAGDALVARIQGPSSFGLPAAGAALRYSDIKMPIRERHTSRAAVEADRLHMVLVDPDHPDEPDELDFVLDGQERGGLQFAGIPVAALPFTRHTGPVPTVASDWELGRTYAFDTETTTPNADMAAIYDEDQRVRQAGFSVSRADWAAIEKSDAERRQRTAALIAAGALQTPDDYRKAAFVFQHGSRSDDYLVAHTLALVALAKGDTGAAWIAAATLDRYLQSIRQPQIYGTQFDTSGAQTSQGAYDQKLISDRLRAELGVPTIAAQTEQMKNMTSPPAPAR